MIIVNGTVVQQNHFPDNTLHLSLSPKESNLIVEWRFESDAELFTLICVRKYYANIPAVLVMDYLPHARMDRVSQKTDVFTLKYFCEVINWLHFDQVYVTDAHSDVSLALLNNVTSISPQLQIKIALQDYIGNSKKTEYALFFPDEGAMKRYSKMDLDLPYTFGIKKRDWATGKILSLDIAGQENILNKKVLIVDDICSKGGTFFYSALALKKAGANEIRLYVTHCENTILQGELFNNNLITKIYTTHSLVHCKELENRITYVDNNH